MPELAEVELARRQWAIAHQEVVTEVLTHPKSRIYRDCPAAAFRILQNKTLQKSRAHGKRMLFTFSPDLHLEIHLGMSGKLSQAPTNHLSQKHDHLIIKTSSRALIFNDYRMFGRAMLHDTLKPWKDLPPQPHDSAFTLAHLKRLISRHPNKPLKGFLLDQNSCPGIGNWMADEICWRLRTHPATSTKNFDATSLRKEVRFVTFGALKHVADKNSSASQTGFAPGKYVNHVPPKNWLFQHRWKKGGSCPRCHHALNRDTIATRTTAWCPQCQSTT